MISLRESVEFTRRLEKDLRVFNPGVGDSLVDRLETLFETQNVSITTERTSSGAPTVAVLSNRDGVLAVVDITTLRALADGVATETGTVGFADTAFEDLLTHLKETTFISYDTEQLLYASREVEDRARRVGGGTIHVGFQRVPAIDDQRGIYADLAQRGLILPAVTS